MEETTPSAREMDVLKVLWKLGEASVREVRQVLCPNEECAFTTVQTLLRIMTEKGLVAQRAKGRTMYYKAKYTSHARPRDSCTKCSTVRSNNSCSACCKAKKPRRKSFRKWNA